MPGTESSGRPGGNPDIKKYGFKTDRDEPLRSRLQLRVPDSMKQQLDRQVNWQEFVRQAISEKLKGELLERELTTIETEILEGLFNGLGYNEIAKKANISKVLCREIGQQLIDQIRNRIKRAKVNKEIIDLPETEIESRDSNKQSHLPLLSGIYTLECLGNLRKEGERFFLDGITTEGLVNLAPKVNKNFSGTIWKIIYDEAEGIYRLKCLGTKTGVRFLNGVTTGRRLTLVPSAEEIGAKNELSGTKWKIFPVRNELGIFRFNCYGSEEEPFYLDGRTLDCTVGLLEQADVGRSGTRWKVERVSEEVLKKVGLKHLESMPR